MIDAQQAGSPGWWLKRLLTKLGDRQPHYDLLNEYFEGTAAIPVHASKACREAYRRLMAIARTNWAELVVEAVRERMKPVGFRTGASGNEQTDAEAWRIWQANALDADSNLVHRTSLSLGMSYMIVGGVDREIGVPRITPEDPREVIAERDPAQRRKVRAALKVFKDGVAGTDWAYLYLPGLVFRAARRSTSENESPDITWSDAGWEWDSADRLPAPVIPVVPFPNRVDMFSRAQAEFEPHIPLLDRINYGLLNRLEITTLQAFRQRAVKGVPNTDAEGNEIDYDDIFAADPGALWIMPETAELWESGQVDLTPIRQAGRDDVQDLAAATRTPLFYLTPDANNGSAEGASLAREGLVFKTADRIVHAGESHEQVMSLAFLFAGDETRAQRGDMEVLWAPPERFSLAERYDAAVKAQAAGVPWRTVMTDILQFSPQQVDRMQADRAADIMLTTPPPAVPAATNGRP